MKKSLHTIIILALVIVVISARPVRAENPQAAASDRQESGTFSGKKSFEFNNFVLLVVNCGQAECNFDFHHGAKGVIKRIPFDSLDVSVGPKKYAVTSENMGNNVLKVNQHVYKINADTEHLLIAEDGTIAGETGEIHSGVQFLLDAQK